MVVRVPILGILIAVSLLVIENVGANAYVAAKRDVVASVHMRPVAPVQPHIKLPKSKHCYR